MLFDIAMKLARKSMPGGLYDAVSYDWLGRRKHYERIGTYAAIHKHYRDHGIDFRGRRIIEVGCGLQYFTALFMLSEGAESVTLVEPKLTHSRGMLLGFLDAFNAQAPRKLAADDVEARIACYRDLAAIPPAEDGRADWICSFTVLEHVSDLPGFFAEGLKKLKPGGKAYHLVDLSDHTYQVFARFKALSWLNTRRGLYHLRYSPAFFATLNDPKCWMNRALMPDYLKLARAAGFEILSAEPLPYEGDIKIHPALLAAHPEAQAGQLHVINVALTLRKPGAAGAAGA